MLSSRRMRVGRGHAVNDDFRAAGDVCEDGADAEDVVRPHAVRLHVVRPHVASPSCCVPFMLRVFMMCASMLRRLHAARFAPSCCAPSCCAPSCCAPSCRSRRASISLRTTKCRLARCRLLGALAEVVYINFCAYFFFATNASPGVVVSPVRSAGSRRREEYFGLCRVRPPSCSESP